MKLSKAQEAALAEYEARSDAAAEPPRFIDGPNGPTFADGEEDTDAIRLLMAVTGLSRNYEVESFLGNALTLSRNEASKLNALLAMVASIGPRDTIEAHLALQMAAVHQAIIRVSATQHMFADDMATSLNSLTKLTRTYAAQMEAMTRYRAKGGQNMVIRHVHIHDGGQAAFGDFGRGGGGGDHKNRNQPQRRDGADLSERPAMLSHGEELAPPLPVPSGERVERLPVSRG